MTAGGAGPVFVVGSMRSGSTMLRLILDSHPRIAVPPETGFMGALAATKRIPEWKFGDGWYERLGWTEAEVDERLREFYDGMFRHSDGGGAAVFRVEPAKVLAFAKDPHGQTTFRF